MLAAIAVKHTATSLLEPAWQLVSSMLALPTLKLLPAS